MMIDDATLQNALDACPTPLYLFDHQVLNDRITRLRASLPSRIKLCYAMKANPFIVLEASALADCVEACSPGEVLICANAGVPFEKIVLSGVWKDRRCLDDLFQADRIKKQFQRDYLPAHFVARFIIFLFEILVKGMKLPRFF